MSKKEKEVKIEETEKKVVTKYDQKKKRREEEKAKEKKEQKLTAFGGIAVLLVIVAIILYAPINTALTLNKEYIQVAGEKITKVEYDYNYNIVKNNYINTYGSYLSYFGLDTSKDFSDQMYSDTLTWADYFDQLAVDTISRTKALKLDAQAKGFVHDKEEEEYKEFVENITTAAADSGEKVDSYLKNLFGPYATKKRIEPYVREGLVVAAYNDKLMADNKPTDAEVETFYQENKADYDSVDYKQTLVKAELPTEPTDLADEEVEYDPESGVAYTPSDAEKEKAMEDTKPQAEEAEKTVVSDGEEFTGKRRADVDFFIKEWLFDEARKAGDTTVIADTDYNQYYVLAFEKRYREESSTANVRVLAVQGEAQPILDQWNEKGATEDVFIELSRQYNVADYENDGLFENIAKNSLGDVFDEWIFAEGRKAGEAGVVVYDEETQYLIYYVGDGDALYKAEITEKMTNDRVSEYITALKDEIVVNDAKGNLNYLKLEAEKEEDPATADVEE